MRHDLSLFLRDFCEPTNIEVKRETWHRLEYRIKPIYGSPGWDYWLWFSPDYSTVQLYGVAPDDMELETSPISSDRATVAWLLDEIKNFVMEHHDHRDRQQ